MRRTLSIGLALLAAGLLLVPPATAARQSGVVSEGYRSVLSRLARGEIDAALEDLATLEVEAIGEDQNQKQVESLWTTKLRVIRDLIAAESHDVLVPIIVFHHEAAVGYRERRQPILAIHSRRMVDELADFYVKRAEAPAADVFAGWVFSSLGSYVQELRSFSTSRLLFLRALQLDPSNEYALLSVGVSLEMHGKYWEALDYYNRLLKLNPDHSEARLRAVLCRFKGGVPDEVDFRAREELERVALDSNAPMWVRALAFQELAAADVREDRRSTAEKRLRAGLEVVPGDQTLRIQLAALLERRGERREARGILAGIEPAPGLVDSPRRRYDRTPTEGLEQGRQTMRRMMTARLGLIASGLGEPGIDGGSTATERLSQ